MLRYYILDRVAGPDASLTWTGTSSQSESYERVIQTCQMRSSALRSRRPPTISDEHDRPPEGTHEALHIRLLAVDRVSGSQRLWANHSR